MRAKTKSSLFFVPSAKVVHLYCIVSYLICFAATSRADDAAKDVLRRWQEHESSAKSTGFRFTCEVKHRYLKGSLSVFAANRDPSHPVPPADTELMSKFQYAKQKEKYFYGEEGQAWNPVKNRAEPIAMKCAFDGQDCKLLHAKVGDAKFPSAEDWLGEGPHDTLTVHTNTIPIALTYRPAAFLISQDNRFDTVTMGGATNPSTGNNRQTLVFQRGSDWLTFVTIDPDRDAVPTHYTLEKAGRPMFELSISYSDQAEKRSVPSKWSWKQFDESGRLTEFSEVKVVGTQTAEDVPDDLFNVEFPFGTWATEHSKGVDRVYLVLEGGAKRYIPANDADINNYDQLMNPALISAEQWMRLKGTQAGSTAKGWLAAVTRTGHRSVRRWPDASDAH